ncbi:hypothetical protein ACLK18_14680 [Escherichia coli]
MAQGPFNDREEMHCDVVKI